MQNTLIENVIEFNILSVLAQINHNDVLRKVFSKNHDIGLINSLVANDNLSKEVKSDIRLIYDTVISKDKQLLSEYQRFHTPTPSKPKPPKRLGKKAVIAKISQTGQKTESYSALLGMNDIKNDMAKLNRLLIKGEVGESEIPSSQLRQIIALAKTFRKHTEEILNR